MQTTEPDGTEPLENPRHEIYAIERAAGLSEDDAMFVSGAAWVMPREPGEKVTPTKSRVQRQTLRRIDARLSVLAEIERGLDEAKHAEFLSRNRRATAELRWFRMVVDHSGVEPDFDADGNLIPPRTRTKQIKESGQAAVGDQ